MINAGVVVITEFCESGNDVFNQYINYMDRDEATRNDHLSEYNLYQDYMGNPDKTSSLFSANKNILSDLEKQKMKDIFAAAQRQGSLMWQTIISFDNQWLSNNGLYNKQTHTLDDKKIKEVTKNSMAVLLKKEGLDSAVWTAAIHYNTDNIHIHIATVDPLLEREQKVVDGRETYKGRMKLGSIKAMKSKVVNQIVMEQEANNTINSIIREGIIEAKKNSPLVQDPELVNNFLAVYHTLPENKRMWNYNTNVMKSVRPALDELSKQYIGKYTMVEYQELVTLLDQQENKFREAYGAGEKVENNYAENKLKDLYARLGNTILKEMKEFDKQVNKKERENIPEPDSFVWGNSVDDITPEMDRLDEINFEDDFSESDDEVDYEDLPGINIEGVNYCLEWSERYKQAKKQLYDDEPDFSMAHHLLMLEAEKGNVLATHDLGMMYQKGQGVKSDTTAAVAYYKRALDGFIHLEKECNQNEKTYIQYRIGKLYSQGLGVEQNHEEVVKWFTMASEGGNKYAQYSLGNCYFHGNGVEKDYISASKRYQESANQGNGYAAFALGRMYSQGLGVDKDTQKADLYYRQAFPIFVMAENRNPDDKLQYRIATMLLKGMGAEANQKEAIKYFEKSAKLGNIYSQAALIEVYSMTKQMDRVESVVELLKVQAEAEDETAQYYLGKALLAEDYKGRNINEGIEWLEKSTEAGNDMARYKLGKIHLNGEGTPKNINKAIELLSVSADKGNQYAQYSLGKLYLVGEDIKRNVPRAMDYLTESANQGNQYAQYSLGKLYLAGEDVKQDVPRAMDYLTESADQGNQYAQYSLGKIYWHGTDIPQNSELGEYYLRMSMEQGNEFAENILNGKTGGRNKVGENMLRTLDNVMRHLKSSMNNDMQSIKNQIEHDQLLRDIEKEKRDER